MSTRRKFIDVMTSIAGALYDQLNEESPVSAGVAEWCKVHETIERDHLSVRTACILNAMGIENNNQLTRVSAAEILSAHNSSQTVLDQVLDYCTQHGLTLKAA